MQRDYSILNLKMAGMVLVCAGLLSGLTPRAVAEDWPKFGRDLSNSAHSAEFSINSSNVKSLQTKWTFETGGEISTTPAVATFSGQHILFVGSWTGVFYALDAITGQKLWTFTVDYVGGRCNQQAPWCRIGSSPAVDVANKMVYFGSYSGYLYALNALTGQLVWKAQAGDSLAGYEVWSSPAIYNGMVFVGVSSHGDNPCLPGGSVNAYDEFTGQLIWTFNTIDQSTCPGGGVCVGGSIWSSLAIDDVNGIVYAGTGNPGSTCTPPTQNAGLYPDSILALSASTGKLLSYFQAIANDVNDKDFGASPILHFSGTVNQCAPSGTRPLQYWLTEPSKNGYLFTLQRSANGWIGNPQQNFAQNLGFIATPGLLPAQLSQSCDSAGHKITNYNNIIYIPGSAGSLWLYQQLGYAPVTLRKSTALSAQALLGAPAVISDVALFGGSDGNFYAADYNGNLLNTIAVGSPLLGGVAISNGGVYFGSTTGTVYCLSLGQARKK